MATCSMCGKTVSRFDLFKGVCDDCHAQKRMQDSARRTEEIEREELERDAAEARAVEVNERAARMILTTETAHNLAVAERLGIVAAEYVLGMNLFRDFAASVRDVVGGRSATMQRGLREAREAALSELKRDAAALGADAVVGIDLDYSEISGAGKNMLFLVASGTAVKLA